MRFTSKYKSHRLVMKPTVFKINEWGQREATPGTEIQFDNGVYNTENSDEIRFLLGHRYCGIDFLATKQNEDGSVTPVDAKKYLAGLNLVKARQEKSKEKAEAVS